MRKTDWRMGGWADGRRLWMSLGAAVLLSAHPTIRLSAQVGHPPESSPYRDIPIRPGPVLFSGYLLGDRGNAGAGPSEALTFGTRWELPAGRALLLQLSASYLQGDRFIIDPTADSSAPQRRTGPVDTDLLHVEAALQLRLTGAKSWRGLAPYVGAGIGMVFDVRSPGDTTGSGYDFGSKVTFGGGTGVRWYVARQFTVHADARVVLWRLRYPVSFHSAAADGSRVVPLADDLTDWTIHPWLSLGVGWTF